MASTLPAVDPNLENNASSKPDDDLVYGAEIASYTTSLSSAITDYKFENGRRYHAYQEGKYIYPNDDKESDRLDIVHKMFEVRLGGKLHKAPLGKSLQRVLDIGTGTGIWAIDMGDKYPSADVRGLISYLGDSIYVSILGNDLSAIQPRWVPPNVRFEVDDVEADWTYGEKFDYIHARCMAPSIRDWPKLIRQCYEALTPGGWVEIQDIDIAWTSPDGSLKEDSSMLKASRLFIEGTRNNGMEPCPGPKLEGWVKDAGFTEVVHEKLAMPIGPWAKDKALKEVGAWNYLQYVEGLEAFMMALYTRMLGWTPDEVDLFLAQVRAEAKDPKIHSMYYVHVVYGKKPA
ncbi:hypothetical protein MMC16_007667 [Acarospora aff. strigata]|nr:hypothetical protein [Acarospora aff. strigata]